MTLNKYIQYVDAKDTAKTEYYCLQFNIGRIIRSFGERSKMMPRYVLSEQQQQATMNNHFTICRHFTPQPQLSLVVGG